ncbi:MAG: histidine kinase [Acidobacteriota bacterium]|nr:histidine kinase [Acidobacteriota bacterium]
MRELRRTPAVAANGREGGRTSMLQEPRFLSATQFLLTTLVVKLAAMAALATMLARYRRFRHILIFEQRNWPDRLVFALGLGLPLTAGVAARVLLNYDAADLMLEGAFLAGLIAGPYTGALVGLAIALPALAAGEYGAPFFAVGCGFAGGGLREACPKAEIWNFSPFVLLSMPRRVWNMVRRLEVNWPVVLLLAIISLETLRQAVGARYSARLFVLSSPSAWITLVVYLATIIIVSTPIKIWNNARIEHRLQEQEKLLLAAKVEALKSQINPHFLFNTLASVSSLIRLQPETAREVIQKLSGLLRKLMSNQVQFVTLREELAALDEYLDIEVIRFGPRLAVRKSIAPDTLDIIIPSLLLQPLVENCIKHGFARKVGPGTITIRSWRESRQVFIEVTDDGLGISEERLVDALSSGIGLSNVNERLRVLYGAMGRLELTGSPGRGACARVQIPLDLASERITA